MGFDVNDCRFDSRCLEYLLRLLKADIGQSNRFALPFVDQGFQCSPGIEQGDFFVVNHIAGCISRILIVAGLECEGSVDQIKIEVVEPKFLEAGFESGFDALGDDGLVFQSFVMTKMSSRLILPALKTSCISFADFALGLVALGRVEHAKSCLQRRLGRCFGCHGVGNECAKAERGHGTAVVEWYFAKAKAVGSCHSFAPLQVVPAV